MTGLFHVTSALNRDSILAHGLDWSRMGQVRDPRVRAAPELPVDSEG